MDNLLTESLQRRGHRIGGYTLDEIIAYLAMERVHGKARRSVRIVRPSC